MLIKTTGLEKYLAWQDEIVMPAWAEEYNNIHRLRFALTLSMLPDITEKRVLEVGSYGLICSILRMHYQPENVDISFHSPLGPDAIERRTFEWAGLEPFTSYNIDIQKQPFPCHNEAYDFILCAEVIEHMPTDPMALLAELNRICKVGGQVLITTPNLSSLPAIARIIEHKTPLGYNKFKRDASSDRHNIEYTPGEVRLLVESSGFKVGMLRTENVWHKEDNSALADELSRLSSIRFDPQMRGDNIFCLATKVGGVIDRHPAILYD